MLGGYLFKRKINLVAFEFVRDGDGDGDGGGDGDGDDLIL